MEFNLPDLVLDKIVQQLASCGVLQLQALAGTSRQWRSVVSSSRYDALSFESDLKLLTVQKTFRGNVLSERYGRCLCWCVGAITIVRMRSISNATE
jgi:hypothetical protein